MTSFGAMHSEKTLPWVADEDHAFRVVIKAPEGMWGLTNRDPMRAETLEQRPDLRVTVLADCNDLEPKKAHWGADCCDDDSCTGTSVFFSLYANDTEVEPVCVAHGIKATDGQDAKFRALALLRSWAAQILSETGLVHEDD